MALQCRGPDGVRTLPALEPWSVKVENNTTPNAIAFSEATSAFLSDTYPEPLSELERWQYLLSALGHDYDARIVCENHIEELIGDYEGVEYIDDVNCISEERHHTLGDFNVLAAAAHAELERRES